MPAVWRLTALPQSVVHSGPVAHQHIVTAALDQFSFMKNGDIIAEAAGGEPVGDEQGRLFPCHLVHAVIDLELRNRIERRRGLVEDHEGRVFI